MMRLIHFPTRTCPACKEQAGEVGGSFYREADGEFYDVLECTGCGYIWLSSDSRPVVAVAISEFYGGQEADE